MLLQAIKRHMLGNLCFMQRNICALILAALALLLNSKETYALEFDMINASKCMIEEISQNVLVVGDYAGTSKMAGISVKFLSVTVLDPKAREVYKKTGTSEGQFTFTTTLAGDYRTCFTVADATTALNTRIRLDLKTGVTATNWDDIAKKENLDEMATELRKMEQVVKEIHEEMLFFRNREAEMRDLNEATNDRVAWYSISSLVVCLGLGIWQLWHLKRFFQRKKLL